MPPPTCLPVRLPSCLFAHERVRLLARLPSCSYPSPRMCHLRSFVVLLQFPSCFNFILFQFPSCSNFHLVSISLLLFLLVTCPRRGFLHDDCVFRVSHVDPVVFMSVAMSCVTFDRPRLFTRSPACLHACPLARTPTCHPACVLAHMRVRAP